MSYQAPVTIAATLGQIERHEIVLPAIQREFVWQPEQIYNLFDSLMQGYPFGTFLYWKVNHEHNNHYQFYDFVLNYHERDRPHCPKIGQMPNRDVVAVLDGQQRLTALNIGLRGSLARKLPRKHWNKDNAFPTQYLHLDLLWTPADDDDVGIRYRFEFLTREQANAQDGCWFPVGSVLTLADPGPAMTAWLERQDLGDQPLKKPHDVLFRLFVVIRNLPLVSFYEEQSQELEKVLQIFIRTNSGGTVLSYSDLLLSVAVAQWTSLNAREEIHQLVDDLNKIGSGFAFSKDWVLKAGLMLSDIGSVGFKVDNFNRPNMEVLENRWPEIKEVLTLTVELVSSFGFSSTNLGADSALLPIAYYLFAKQADGGYITDRAHASDREKIHKWLIASLLKGGIWGSGLDTLLTALREGIRQSHASFPTAAVRKIMRSRGKSLTFDSDEIDYLTEMRFSDKRTFSLLSLVFPHLDLRQHFHIDHIFPKSLFTPTKLRTCGVAEEHLDGLRDSADHLPNLQLLEGHENLQKRAALPTVWLQTFATDEERQNYKAIHLLGSVPERINDFDAFYEARRQRLKDKIATLLADGGSDSA